MARSRGVRRWMFVGTLLLTGLLASGCTVDDVPRFGWPDAATEQGKRMQHFWSWTVIAALAVGVLVWGLMFWTFAFHRKRKNSPLYPKQTKENLPLELTYTAVPFLMVAVLFYFTVTTENFALKNDAKADVCVDVTAYKWGWDFSYADCAKVGDGGTNMSTSNPIHSVSSSTEVPILMLPENKVIEYVLASRDVIHSFWVPDFVFKRDVFPYPKQNNTVNIIQNKIQRTGAFVGRCAELCGTYHSAMNFEVRSVPQDVFDSYLSYRGKTDPATGAAFTTAAALTQVGNQIKSCGQLCSPTSYRTYPIDPNRAAKSATEPQAAGK